MATQDIDAIEWWHSVPLLDGRVTKGRVEISKLEEFYLFDRIDFRGRSVLDIGCWDGYFSFRAEKRGASRVVGLDDPGFRFGGLAGWKFLHEHFQSRAQWRKGSIYDPPRERFDVVLCYGVLYHVNDPLTAATNAFQLANELVAFEGHFFRYPEGVLWLLAPGAIHSDATNIYCMSDRFLTMVADMNGFRLKEDTLPPPDRRPDPLTDRGTMLFERVAEARPLYRDLCYSTPPINVVPATPAATRPKGQATDRGAAP